MGIVYTLEKLWDSLMMQDSFIQLGMLAISVVSALIAGGSLWFTYAQWKKIKRKIGVITDVGKAMEILPAWYTGRMMTDIWWFGLLTSDGRTLVVSEITGISDDGKWLDVELVTKDSLSLDVKPNYVFAVADDRTSASVQISSIVAALELVTS